jgi:putative heme-binding domain-containing protein
MEERWCHVDLLYERVKIANRRVAVLSAVFVSVAAGLVNAQHNFTPADIQDGRQAYSGNCVVCHGADGDLISGIDLGHGKFKRATSDEQLVDIVLKGIPDAGMPPHPMPEFMAQTIVAYLRSMATEGRTPVRGDTARGKSIYETKGGCASCHRINSSGSRVGPDLSDIGALRRVTEIERSLKEPDAEILPQNRYYRAVTKSGEIVTGRLLNLDTFTVQLIDTKEMIRTLKKADLREESFVEKSPMPSFQGKLSATELDDVVAYLASLKGF